MATSLVGVLRGGDALKRIRSVLRHRSGTADLAIASAVLLVAVPSVLTGKPPEGPLAVTLPVALTFVVAVALRSRLPLAAVALVSVAGVVQAVVDTSPGSLWAFASLLLVGMAVGQCLDEGPATVGLVVLLLGLWIQEWRDGGEDYLFILVVFGGVWLVGRGLRAWKSRATAAEAHQRDLARLAVAEERVRIARELHDVVAHGLSVIAVQADAAQAALGREPALAHDPLVAIQSSAREALGEMRQMLALLRTDADESEPVVGWSELDARAPARAVADLARLVDSMRGAGLDVTADIEVDTDPDLPTVLSPGLQLAIYRIAQEGLTNVVKHARSAPTRLHVWEDGAEVVVEVENEPPPTTGGQHQDDDDGHPTTADPVARGHGLVGIRERAHALGGTSGAARTPEGGHLLWARMPSRRLP